MTQYYIFAIFIGLMVFALAFWFKKTPRETMPRKESEMLAEKEGKLFRLYQNLEDMMDSFENYVEEETLQVARQREVIDRVEQRVTQLSDRIETAAATAEEAYGRATIASEKAERLAAKAATEIRKQMVAEQQSVPAAEETIEAEPEKREKKRNRALEPIVARPAVAKKEEKHEEEAKEAAEPVGERIIVHKPEFPPIQAQPEPVKLAAAEEITYKPVAKNAQAEMVQQIAAARLEKEKERLKQEENKQQQGIRIIQNQADTKFEAVLPEYSENEDLGQIAASAAAYTSYTRPAPMKMANDGEEQNSEKSRKQRVLNMHGQGYSDEEIARELGMAKGAISFILDLQGKIQ